MEEPLFIAGIGSSAGGLDPLREFFENVSPYTSCAFVVISHLPISGITFLPSILQKDSKMTVEVLERDIFPEANHVYVLPGNLRVTISNGMLKVRMRRASEVINTAVDEFLFSLAEDQKHKGIAIILAGLGTDGSMGAKRVHDRGGIVLVQEPKSTNYRGMPIASIEADHPDEILPAKALGIAFLKTVGFKAASNNLK